MKEMKIKQFEVNEVNEITLLSIEEADKIPKSFRACGDWWWVRSPGFYQNLAISVRVDGDVYEIDHDVIVVSLAVRPAFRISNLESEIGDPVRIGKTWCTVVDKDLVLANHPICSHRFDKKSNNWETSELKAFIESDEFKAMI